MALEIMTESALSVGKDSITEESRLEMRRAGSNDDFERLRDGLPKNS